MHVFFDQVIITAVLIQPVIAERLNHLVNSAISTIVTAFINVSRMAYEVVDLIMDYNLFDF